MSDVWKVFGNFVKHLEWRVNVNDRKILDLFSEQKLNRQKKLIEDKRGTINRVLTLDQNQGKQK